MATLSSELIILFFALGVTIFLWRFLRDRPVAKAESNKTGSADSRSAESIISTISATWQLPLALIVPVSLLLLGSKFVGLSLIGSTPFFCGGVFIPYLLGTFGLTAHLRSLLLLMIVAAMTILLPVDQFKMPIAAALTGTISWKVVENLALEEKSSLEDIVPAVLWLSGMYWLRMSDTATMAAVHQKLFAAGFIAALFLRWVQGPFLKEDRLYVKRITLSLVGGLIFLCIVTKMIVAIEFAILAALAGAGYLLAYVLEDLDGSSSQSKGGMDCFKQLLFIGILTLLATRFFGILGLLILGSSMLIATSSAAVCIAALFWAGRTFAQAFIFDFNTNVTGINLTHAYTGAALYGGFLIAVALALLLRSNPERKSSALLFLSACLIAPVVSNFFLHAEPASSLVVSALAACLLLALCCQTIFGAESRLENLILPPVLLACVGSWTGELIYLGNTADMQLRLTVLGAVVLLSAIILALAGFLKKRSYSS